MESPTKTGADGSPPDFRDFAAARARHLVRTAYLPTGGDATCDPATRPDGSALLTTSYGSPGSDESDLNVVHTLPNGRQVQVQERIVDRSVRQPPLDAAALTALHAIGSFDRRPDGTMVNTTPLGSTQSTSSGGYLADALFPDGTRVVIRLRNATAGQAGAQPGTPVLTLDQLSALVADRVRTAV